MNDVAWSWSRDGGRIELLRWPRGLCHYRVCAGGYCRYAVDRWQAENRLDHLLARFTPSRVLDGRIRLEAQALGVTPEP